MHLLLDPGNIPLHSAYTGISRFRVCFNKPCQNAGVRETAKLPSMRFWLCAGLATVTSCAFAQQELFGEKSYTSFRGISGLSGGGFGVGLDGRITLRGATALSTPIGFTLGPRQWFVYGSNLSSNLSPSFPSKLDFQNDATRNSNGSAGIMASWGTSFGTITVGGVLTTGDLDSSLNLQFQPAGQNGTTRISIGVQDVFSTSAANNGAIQKVLGGGTSVSPFAVASTSLGRDAYVSYGLGLNRFKGPFGSLSVPVGPVQGFIEYDTFNWNVGLTARIWRKEFDLGERERSAWVSAGVVRGKYLYWSLGFAF